MYHDLIGRTPDSGGLVYWVNNLNHGANPTNVAYGFAASAEREGMRVGGIYQTFLGRSASQAEIDYWVARFVHGATSEDIEAGFAGSAEYYRSAAKGKGDNTDWITSAYLDVLHRAAMAGDISYWLGVLR